MSNKIIHIEAIPLQVSLKTTFRHAAATRNEGESIWIKASRNDIQGFGEGCPRPYSAGDDLESSLKWISKTFKKGAVSFKKLQDLTRWVEHNSALIDSFPSAWCAVEMALLDLLSREKGCSVETLLGIEDSKRLSRYTAVLGDDKTWKYTELVEQYLIRGFTDYKIKLNGDIERDKQKLSILEDLSTQHHAGDIRVRLDANNLWANRPEDAIQHLLALDSPIFAVEEPVEAGHLDDISKVCEATGLPVILDESLCTIDDLSLFSNLPGKFIANIKLSRVGGLTRALKMIDVLKELGWPIIIGCHVGETSLMTRAGLIVASAAGDQLVAHEGAFGDYLVEREPVAPMLKFGRNGLLDLNQPYWLKSVEGLQSVPTQNWNVGFGMHGRMPYTPDDGQPEVNTLKMPDGYNIHYRIWGPPRGEDVLIILHGGMSHSGWQAPLATTLRSLSPDITIVAPDRRGCGLNENRGDLGSVEKVIDDVVKHVEFLKSAFTRVHLAGWCQGSQYASIAAVRISKALSSLILLTPGFFWNERFRSVISIAENIVFEMINEFKLKPDREHASIPIPMEASDFTLVDEWLDFIEKDELKTTKITLKSASIMDEVQELSWGAVLQNRLPTLAILAEKDRIVDNTKFQQFMGPMFAGESRNSLIMMDSGHAIQFERPEEVAKELIKFLKG